MRIAKNNICLALHSPKDPKSFSFLTYAVKPRMSLTANLREAIENEPALARTYANTTILACGPATFVPLADFQEEDCEAIYDYCFPKAMKRRVFYDTIPGANAVLLFAIDDSVCRTIEDGLGKEVQFVSAITPVLRHFSLKGTDSQRKRLFVYCHEQLADIAVFEENRLIVANTFSVHTPTDIAYYVFNVSRHLALSNANDLFYVAGQTALRTAAINELGRYAKHVNPINASAEYNRDIVAGTEEMPYDMVTQILDR